MTISKRISRRIVSSVSNGATINEALETEGLSIHYDTVRRWIQRRLFLHINYYVKQVNSKMRVGIFVAYTNLLISNLQNNIVSTFKIFLKSFGGRLSDSCSPFETFQVAM